MIYLIINYKIFWNKTLLKNTAYIGQYDKYKSNMCQYLSEYFVNW